MSSITKEECGILFNLFDAYASKGVFLVIEYEAVFNTYMKLKTHIESDKEDLTLDNTTILHLRNILKLCSQRTGTDIDSWSTIIPIYQKIAGMVQTVTPKIESIEE